MESQFADDLALYAVSQTALKSVGRRLCCGGKSFWIDY